MQVTISPTVVSDYMGTSTTATLKIFATKNFFNDGVEIIGSRKGSANFCKAVACTISGGVITIPSFTLESTTDSSDDTARYCAVLYDALGTEITTLCAGLEFSVPPVSPISWTTLTTYNQSVVRTMPDTYLDANQTSALMSGKQDRLISGASIKTINSGSVLGTGDIPVQVPLVSGTNLKTVNGLTLLGAGNIQGEQLLSAYTDFATALSSIGSTKTILKIDTNSNVPALQVVPSNVVLRPVGGLLTKTSTGAIQFQGVGLDSPESQTALFSGFASGDVTWTGSNYPTKLSSKLWADTNISDRLIKAMAALASKSATIIGHPGGNLATVVRITSGHNVYLTAGDYPNTNTGYQNVTFLMESDTRLYGDGPQTIVHEAVDSVRTVQASSVETPPYAGTNQNIFIDHIQFFGNPSCPVDSAGSAIYLGNIKNGGVQWCTFTQTHGFHVYVGAFGNNGYTADGFWITDNNVQTPTTQSIGTVGGKNGYIQRNRFIVDTPASNPAFISVIDIEPNANTDGTENLWITDNLIDGRGALSAFNGITVQRGFGGYLRQVYVERNIIMSTVPQQLTFFDTSVDATADTISLYGHGFETGQPVNIGLQGSHTALPGTPGNDVFVIKVDFIKFKVASSYANAMAGTALNLTAPPANSTYVASNQGALSNGIQLWSADASIVADNLIVGASQSSINLTNTHNSSVRDNQIKFNGASGSAALELTNCQFNDIDRNKIKAVAAGHDVTIHETNGTLNILSGSGFLLSIDTSGNHLDYGLIGATVNINGGDSVVSSVDGSQAKVFPIPGGSLAPASGTIYSENNYKNNDALITLSAGSRSRIVGDYLRVVSDSYAPAQITVDQNNYDPGRNSFRLDLSTSASKNITGLGFTDLVQVNGEKHLIYNSGSFNIVLRHQNASSAAANRFSISSGADFTLAPGQGVSIEYNSTLSRWLVFAAAGIGGVTGGTDNAVLRADGTGGLTAQGSTATIADDGTFSTGGIGIGSNAIIGNGGTDLMYIGSTNSSVNPALVYQGAFNLRIFSLLPSTPAQITSDQNDYTIVFYNGCIARLSTDAARNVTGIDWGQGTTSAAGGMLYKMIINVGSFNLTLKHQSASSLAANRMICSTGADIVLTPNQTAELFYDFTDSRWRVFKKN